MLSSRRGPSLRVKIVAWTFVPTVIILSVVALLGIYAYQRTTEEMVVERNQELTRLLASQLTTEMGQYANTLAALARTVDIYQGNPAKQQMALKLASNRLVVFDGGVVILNNYGIVVASEPLRTDAITHDWSARPYFRQMVRLSGPVFSDIVADGLDGADVIAVAVPITGPQGEFVGAMVGMFRVGVRTVSAFYGSIVKLRIGIGGQAYVVDGSGKVIYHAEADGLGEDFSHLESAHRVLTGQVGAIRTRDVAGHDISSSFAPVPGTLWGLVNDESWSTLMQPSRRYGEALLLLLILGVAIPSLVVAVGVQRLAQPIADLSAAARAVAAGNFGRTISAPTGDELEELANQFNLMSAELAESYAHLEQRVAARTKDLAALNAISTVVSGSLDIQEIADQALEKTMAVLGTEVGAAYRVDEAAQVLKIMSQRGISAALMQEVTELPLTPVRTGQPIEGDQPLIWPVADYPEGTRKQALMSEGLQLIIVVPLRAKDRNLGALVLGTRTARTLSAEETALLPAIGRQVGMAAENARLYEKAEESAVVAERQRLARELHDAVTQTLFSASLIADVLPRLWERKPEEAQRRLAELRDLTRGALAEMRMLLHELRPASLLEIPLPDLLRQLAEAMKGRARIPVALQVEGEQQQLPPPVQVGLYRIAQEALNNVAKHAGASEVTLALRYLPAAEGVGVLVNLCISDNGCGFSTVPPPATSHLGLAIMRERAAGIGARLSVDSVPEQGTLVTVAWPEGRNEGTKGIA